MKFDRKKNATRNILFGLLLKVYQIVLPFTIRTVIIYYLGVEYVGVNSLFASVLQVLNLAELGVGSAMVFGMYKPIANDDKVTMCALLKLYKTYYRIIGVIIAVLGVSTIPFLHILVKGDVPEGISLYALFSMNLAITVLSYWLFSYKNSVLQAYQRSDMISKIGLIMSTLQYAGQILTLVVLKNYYAFVAVALLIQVMQNLVTARVATRLYPDLQPVGELEHNTKDEIDARIRDLFAIKVGSIVVSSVDTIVISAFLGLTTLAIYQNYYFIMISVCGVIGVIFDSVLAGVGNSFVTETKEKNYEDFKVFSFLVCSILCVCSCCFVAMYQPFMNLWLKRQELILDYKFVVLFTVFFYVHELSMIWATYKDATGIWHEDRWRPLVSAGVNLILNIVLVNIVGLYGVILSTIISYVFISMPWLLHILFKNVFVKNKREYISQLLVYIFVSVLCCVVTFEICRLVALDGWMGLFIKCVLAIFIAFFIQLLIYRNSDNLKNAINFIKGVVRK